jgi:adenylosuccinate lyase
MLARMADIVANMKVFPARMLRNLDSTQGLVFSGQVLQDLVEAGMPREEAYKTVQSHAMQAWETETSFREKIANDPNVKKYLDAKALEHTFDLKRQLRSVDAIFRRTFETKSTTAKHL